MPFQTIYVIKTKERYQEHISSDEMMWNLLPMFGDFAFFEDDEVQSQKILQEQLCPVCREKTNEETPNTLKGNTDPFLHTLLKAIADSSEEILDAENQIPMENH